MALAWALGEKIKIFKELHPLTAINHVILRIDPVI